MLCALLVSCAGSPYVKPVADPDLPDWTPPATRGEGPLSLTAKVPETAWSEQLRLRKIRDEHYVSKQALVEDAAAFRHIVDTFYRPRTQEQAIGVQVAHEADTLWRLAPYPLEAVLNAFSFDGYRLGICVCAPHVLANCEPGFQPRVPPRAAFKLREDDGIAVLAVHDLSASASWDAFGPAFDKLLGAKGIVIDMQDAAGDDPRPLLPLLERLTGRAPLTPLAAIVRPADADRYVATYNRWFTSHSRDREVWQRLVGTMPAPSRPARPRPIAIVVGPGCRAACELVARVLATYAGATISGNVRRRVLPTLAHIGRVSRDEPAMLRLPHSKLDVFFHATEYVLAPAIERATGPTGEWHLVDEDRDYLGFAIRETRARLAGGFARCDALPAYADPSAMPATLHPKLQAASTRKSCTKTVLVRTDPAVPASALERFAATCGADIKLASRHMIPGAVSINAELPFAFYSQLAQSELVTSVKIECHTPQEPEPDSGKIRMSK